jgi:ubiquinone/menaquinone biosynthesis C-methylase UbiE
MKKNSNNIYKTLFEGKFVKTHKHDMKFVERVYYGLSASTFNEKKLFQQLKTAVAKKELKLIDLGCGGGHFELTNYGQVYGVDISLKSLKNSKKIYHEVKEADLSKKIPYPKEFFDIAFCSEVFGHIEKKDKESFLKEVKRILKKGGYLCFSIETLGDNWLTRTLKKKDMYKSYWIDYQGHIGLESPEKTIDRFKKEFNVVSVVSSSKSLLPVDGYLIFQDKLPLLKVFNISIIRRIANIILMPFFLLSLRLSPLNASNDIIIVAQKK